MGLRNLVAKAKEESKQKLRVVEELQTKAVEYSDNLTKEWNGFPLRPSGALKSERDLYYGLCNYFKPGSITVDPIRNPILLDLGHAIEGHLVRHLERAFRITNRNHSVQYAKLRRSSGEEIVLSGELDFCIELESGETILCDSKSSSDFVFRKSDAFPKEEHIAQLHCYLKSEWARNLKINRAWLFYYNKNNSEIRVFEFTYNPAIADAVVERFQRVLDSYESGKIPPREHVFGLDWQVDYSSFKTYDNAEFRTDLASRKVINVKESYFEDMDDNEIKREIACKYGNAVMKTDEATYWLELGMNGLLLKSRKTL